MPTVTPEGLRAAARAIIIDGVDGTSAAERHANRAWTERLVFQFKAHRTELMARCKTYPPDSAAEIRLLRYCHEDLTEAADLAATAIHLGPPRAVRRWTSAYDIGQGTPGP